ncbi:translation initiation factor IF3-1, mitochondrial-like [Senna tora]|uniref:Translation initiation factor IF3-1, mitochondrial-like n=1 Tax=Senna tora TaxID=362788 RepID=A0A834SXK1_9FABA|nr:translation initiation factor IF3-1, mitochondrial-like [Senna tora]
MSSHRWFQRPCSLCSFPLPQLSTREQSRAMAWTKDMAYWRRIGQSKLKLLSSQFRRCYIELPNASLLNSIASHRKPPVRVTPYWVFPERHTDVCHNVRFFAAPVQARTKKEQRDTGEPRLNEEITARFVRLVIDDGHSIVSRSEALEHARRLKLDLVEVQKTADPPVCKIMDYNKEKYKRQEIEKERTKMKELKDLKMKADMVKNLMEKGYRVKCIGFDNHYMLIGLLRASGKENEDVEGILSRLSSLIEDVAIVESGPHVGKKEAYMLVRHVKYGPKKGSGKKLQDAAHMSIKEAGDYDEEDQNQSSAETDEDMLSDDKHMPLSMGRASTAENHSHSDPPAMIENRYKRGNQPSIIQEPPTLTENRYKRNNSPSFTQEPSAVTENRYKRTDSRSNNNFPSKAQKSPVGAENRYNRTEPRIRFQQTTPLDNPGLTNKGPGIGDSFKAMPSVLNHKRPGAPETNVNSKTVVKEDTMPPLEDPKGGLPHPNAPKAPRSGYGIFSSNTGIDTPDARGGMHRSR